MGQAPSALIRATLPIASRTVRNITRTTPLLFTAQQPAPVAKDRVAGLHGAAKEERGGEGEDGLWGSLPVARSCHLVPIVFTPRRLDFHASLSSIRLRD